MVRKAHAAWDGTIKTGNGRMKLGSGAFEGNYSFTSRFEHTHDQLKEKVAGNRYEGEVDHYTNPEELIGAAHAGCYSMALSLFLEQAGHTPERIETDADVSIEAKGDGFAITGIHLSTKVKAPGIDEKLFKEQADSAKENCPVSQALAGTNITLDAQLVS
jgi:osmotically inducible protein OsmC